MAYEAQDRSIAGSVESLVPAPEGWFGFNGWRGY
jgi:hypothetical protein